MKALANKDVVPLRTSPSYEASLTDEILYGMPVEILSQEEQSGWCHIRTHYQYEGYCRVEDLMAGDKVSVFLSGDIKVIIRPYIDVLSEARVQGICLQSVPRGGRVCALGNVEDKEGWLKVRLVDGRIGYTKACFLDTYYEEMFTEDEDIFRKKVVDTAKLYLGTQYRWGGKSPLGIDCSGLTSMSYMLCGVLIYRDAQIKENFPVHEIAFECIKPGDLLYFPGHIAMYIGDDLYIHSTGLSGSDGVVINSLNPESELYRADLPDKLTCAGSIF